MSSSILVIVALLGIALVSGLGRRGPTRGVGAEFVVGGVIVGPALLGLVRRETLEGLEPLILMGLGWLAAAIGARHAAYRGQAVSLAWYANGVVLGLAVAAVTVGTTLALRPYVGELQSKDWALFACLGCAGLAVTDDVVRSPASTEGSVAERLRAAVGYGTTLPALLALSGAVIFSPPHVPVSWPTWVWTLLGPVLGVVLGLTVAALLGRKFRYGEFWPVMIGAALLGAGLAARFRVSTLAATFTLGVAIAAVSPHRGVVRELMGRATAPLLLPLALLAGALVVWPRSSDIWLLAAALTLGRLLVHYALGRLFAAVGGARSSHDFALSLLPTGHLGLAIGIMAPLRLSGPLGSAVLLSICLTAIVGELLGVSAIERLTPRAPDPDPKLPTEVAHAGEGGLEP